MNNLNRQVDQLPGSQGHLLQKPNNSLVFIKPPRKAIEKQLSATQYQQIINNENANSYARKLAQGSFNSFWLRDKSHKTRIFCEPSGQEMVLVNGQQQSVPAYEPSKVFHK